MVQIVMIIFGVIALTKGEITIFGKRKIRGVIGRIVGSILLTGGLLGFIPVFFDGTLAAASAYLCGGAFLLAIAIGIVGMFMGDETDQQIPSNPS